MEQGITNTHQSLSGKLF